MKREDRNRTRYL